MLEELHVKNLALIEDVTLRFGAGMTVLTGETGAGKTALLGALKLLLGERADAGAVRSGAREAVVEGRFFSAGREVIVRRRVGADGRSRCTLDDEMATVGALAKVVGPLVDLHGQHEHQALLAVSTHVGYLDRWAGEACAMARADYADARLAYKAAALELAELEHRLAAAEANEDYLRFVVEEIDRVDPQVGEDELLGAKLPTLQNAERLSQAAGGAAALLRGDGGALDKVAEAQAVLEKLEGIDPELDAIAARLVEAAAVIDDAGVAARSYRDGIEHDPAALERVLARLSELAGVMKKYGPRLDDVVRKRDEARASLLEAHDGGAAVTAARERLATCRRDLERAGAALSRVRVAAADGFAQALAAETADLAMPGARFEVAFTDLDFDAWGEDGPQRVEFLYAPAPGQPARPLARIASGGELSRVMLALKGVLGNADTVGTLVFDEVDAGIGGATATAVGRRLVQLAQRHQVIVVTHLAQVAAFADEHLVVSKRLEGDVAVTAVNEAVGEDRVAEVARLLSGNDSAASRAHAREVLDAATTAVPTSDVTSG